MKHGAWLKHGHIFNKSEFHTLLQSFEQDPFFEMDTMLNVNFLLSSDNKDQFKELHNNLNEKLINAIKTLNVSTLTDNLIKSHQVEYLSSALILAKAVDND